MKRQLHVSPTMTPHVRMSPAHISFDQFDPPKFYLPDSPTQPLLAATNTLESVVRSI